MMTYCIFNIFIILSSAIFRLNYSICAIVIENGYVYIEIDDDEEINFYSNLLYVKLRTHD